jgi:glycosyltransferase 2 family protein
VIGKIFGSLWFRALLTLGVLIVLASRVDVPASFEALLRLKLPFAVSVLALVALDRAIMIGRWALLLKAAGAPIQMASILRIYLVSSFVGAFLPAGVGADAARAYSLSLHTSQGTEAIASVAVDRLLGLLSILTMAVVGVVAVGAAGAQADRGTNVLVLVVTLAAGAAGVLWADRWMRAALPEPWHGSRPGARVLRLADALSAYRTHRPTLVTVFLLSIGVQVLRILQAFLLGLGLGIDVPFSYYLFFMPIGLIALLLPISISGFGAPQAIIVWLLQPKGVPEHDALALSTLIVLTGIVANLPGALLYLGRRT